MKSIKKQYKLVNLPHKDFTCVQLLKPPFRGLIYSYKKVKFRKIEENGEEKAMVSFIYDIIDNSMQITPEQMQVPEFKNLLGDILMDMLEDALDSGFELQPVDKSKKTIV